ncbi:MAG: hypothetical protein A2539_01275 [Elusimicrobia bacterium RIFOXYD2_FULL_34_15]|nr:MAG: hypothetical protein A2539_01275 [Elusimicrobia bacterium RIFOXYD2_FULL_34_15]
MKTDRILDCTGLFCPMPIIKTKVLLDTMKSGQVLEIDSDDPGFEKDLAAWCKMTGEKFVGIEKDGSILKGYVIKK